MFLKRFQHILVLFSLLMAFYSCKDHLFGDLSPNQAPETYTVVDTIMRYGQDRFITQIVINWWGEDPDGFIKGFEFSFDKKTWYFTQKQDSTFLVSIPPGQDTFDFSFFVRSIDNEGLVDTSPAYIVFPVKNSPPTVDFEYAAGNPKRKPDNTFPVLKFNWKGSDPDGIENIAYYELYLNDTSSEPLIIDAVYNTVILKMSFNQNFCKVYQGNNLTLHADSLGGLKLNDTNQLLIRAVDLVGEKSPLTYSYKLMVRKPNSKTLLVNAYSSNIQVREDFYTQNLLANGITDFDIIRVKEVLDDHYTELAPDNITQTMIFSMFDVIIWFGKEIDYSLALAQRTTDDFISRGGRMFMAVEIASNIDDQAGYLEFSPIDSLVSLPTDAIAFRISNGSDVNPIQAGWPQLKTDPNKFIPSARPFYEDLASVPLYDAVILKSTSTGSVTWQGKSTIMAKRTNALGKTTFIISSLELHNLNGNGNMNELFSKLFITELGL